MKLDTPTIVAIGLAVDFFLVLVLFHTWRTRTTYPSFVVWMIGTVCWSVGSLLSLMLPALHPQFIPKIIGNGLIMLHPLLLYEGIRRFHDIRSRWWGTPLNSAVVMVGIFCILYFFYVSENIVARIIAVNLVAAFLFARTSIEPLFYARVRRYSMQWLLSVFLLPVIVLVFSRAWYHVFSVSLFVSFSGALSQDTILRWIMFYGIIAELAIAYSYLSLTSDRVEQELRETQEREKNISKVQRQFFGMVTHEFKTPLSVINRSAQMIAYTAATEDDALIKRVTTIRDNSVNLTNLLDACMNDAVMARGELHLVLADFDLTALLNNVRQHCSDVSPERVLELTTPDAPQMYHGDERLLFHLAVNLADNALKFSALPVSIRLVRTADAFCITVTDKGVGIPAAEIPNLGERTYRATTAQNTSGSGIGLHTARLIAGLHRGTITFVSPLGEGTIVTVLLPVS